NAPLFASPPDPTTGNPGECVAGLAPCRWGDYSGAQRDSCDPSFVWTSTEFSDSNTSSGANWATWIAPVTFSGARVPANCANAPTITGLTPSCGNAGDTITITGTNFVAGTVVYFGNVLVTPNITSTTSMTAKVPTA